MHPLVKEMITKGKALNLNLREIGKRANVSYATITKWVNKGVMPQKPSIKKIKKVIEQFDSGEIKEPETPTKLTPNQVIKEEWPEERKEFYRMVYKVENKYGRFSTTPDTDKDLYELHKFLGVKPLMNNKDGSIKYCRIELDKLRKQHKLRGKDMSEIAGKSPGWYKNFMHGRDFTEDLAETFADYFNIPVEDLLNSEYRKEVLADAKN